MKEGVLSGCEQSHEWLLPWFFERFRTYNPDCPLAFADFGMTPKGKEWCRERGILVAVPELPAPVFSSIFFEGEEWIDRKLESAPLSLPQRIIFRKPLALSQSPFQRTLWLDLDCQVRGSLTSLLSFPLGPSKLAVPFSSSFVEMKNLTQNRIFVFPKCCTGIVLTSRDSPLLEKWAFFSRSPLAFQTDEGSLCFAAERSQMLLTMLPHLFHWPVVWGVNDNALIYHWLGQESKSYLRQLITCGELELPVPAKLESLLAALFWGRTGESPDRRLLGQTLP